MTDLRALLDVAADATPASRGGRADRAVTTARRVRRTRVAAVVAGAVAAVVAGALVVPVAARLGTIEPAGPGLVTGLPDQVYAVPLHAPSVGEGVALGQPAAFLLGGLPRADGLLGQSCCHLAVVGASTDAYAFLDLPGMTDVGDGGASAARLAPDGRVIAYATPGGIGLLNLVDGTSRTLDAPRGWHLWSVLAWSADGTRLAVATGDPSSTGPDQIGLATVTVADPPSWTTPELGVAWDGSTKAVALAPDGAQIALAQDGELRVAPVDAGEARILLSGIGPVDPQVAWSADGARIAALGFSNRRDQDVGPAGSGAAWHKGRYVEVATGKPGLFDIQRGFEVTAILGFSGESHLLALVSPAGGSGPFAFVHFELATSDRSTVTRVSDAIDPQQVSAAAALLDDPPRSSEPPTDLTRGTGPVAVVSGLVVLLAALLYGRIRRRRALR